MTDHPRSLVPGLILVGTDYGPASVSAANHALELARTFAARVHLVHAWLAPYAPAGDATYPSEQDHPDLLALLRRAAHDQMAAFVATLDTSQIILTTSVESGEPPAVLLRYAESHGCDWVVVGKRSMSPVAEWLMGNVAAYVVRHCQVPVLVVPSQEAT